MGPLTAHAYGTDRARWFDPGWAVADDALDVLVGELRARKPSLAVELGSGRSTIAMAMTVAAWGGRLVSVEHDAAWAFEVRRHLSEAGLDPIAQVIDAPLSAVDRRSGAARGRSRPVPPWYAIPDDVVRPGTVGVLFVDGPPNAPDEGGDARSPALPRLNHWLAHDSVVLVDDALRDGERNMVDAWRAEYPDWDAEYLPLERGMVVLRRGRDMSVLPG